MLACYQLTERPRTVPSWLQYRTNAQVRVQAFTGNVPATMMLQLRVLAAGNNIGLNGQLPRFLGVNTQAYDIRNTSFRSACGAEVDCSKLAVLMQA